MIRKLVIAIVLVVVGCYGALLATLYARQTSLEFNPNTTPIHLDTSNLQLSGLEPITLHTADGLALHAWFRKPADGQPTILMLHGNAGNLNDTSGRIAHLSFPGWGLLALEYRGYGGNPGTPSQPGFANDTDAAMTFLRDQKIAAQKVVVYGHSMGTGVGTAVAAKWPVAALVLDSPFTSIADVAQKNYWYVPAGALLRSKFPILTLLPRLHAPLLIIQGARDHTVPPEMGRADYAAAHEPKTFWCAPDAGHMDVLDKGGAAVLQDFLNRYVAPITP